MMGRDKSGRWNANLIAPSGYYMSGNPKYMFDHDVLNEEGMRMILDSANEVGIIINKMVENANDIER